jgi:hypothetical protein
MPIIEMFKIGDLVYEKRPVGAYRLGSIVHVYAHESRRRCVVQFEDGREEVFFESQLWRSINASLTADHDHE